MKQFFLSQTLIALCVIKIIIVSLVFMMLLLSRTLIVLSVNIMIIMPPVWLLLSMLPLFQTFIIHYNYVCSLVHHRVTYKIAELTFKALHVDLSPTYLQQFLQVYTPAMSLRSACSYTLVANRSRTVAGDCTFVHAAATVWNALPVSVTSKDSLLSFKAALKTHLCALAYT